MRITSVLDDTGVHILKVEGRVSGAWADELRRVFEETRRTDSNRLVVDLTSVTFIDDAGKKVLKHICDCDAKLLASGCHTRLVVEEITG